MERNKLRALSAMFLLAGVVATAGAGEVCELLFTECPESFNGQTITVPEKVVALGASIRACGTVVSSTSTAQSGQAPSIMFVIDHSGSMTGEGSNSANDRWGSRYTVTKALLDTIYRTHPDAEVGVAVFAAHLYFDKTSTQYFANYFQTLPTTYDGQANQAYLKPLTLNQTYDGRRGIDIIKEVLATDTVSGSTNQYVDLRYQPNFDPKQYTNINIGFIAAKDALQRAVNPPERRFVIFLSDGEPKGNDQAGLSSSNFTRGTGMPATFTVYFTSGAAPSSLVTMTNNIRANGYSSSNPQSDLWTIQTSHTALLDLLMKNVIQQILLSGDPRRMVVNNVNSVAYADSQFTFSDRFPLQTTTTPFTAAITYRITNPETNTTRDTTATIAFSIERRAGATVPAGVKLNCWQQPDLQFNYNGAPIQEITPEMTQVQVRLTPNGETVTSPQVDLTSGLETERFTLGRDGTNWTVSFQPVSAATPIAGDKKMQHMGADSIIAVYRNPRLPLDTVRVSIPVRARPMAIPVTATLRDVSGDGRIDRIDITWTDDTIRVLSSLPSGADFLSRAQLVVPGGATVTLTPGTLSRGTGRTIQVAIVESSSGALQTGWSSASVVASEIAMTEQGNMFVVTKVVDGAGPVIDRAFYYPGTNGPDTLRVALSEPVDCALLQGAAPGVAFVYYTGADGPDGGKLAGATWGTSCPTQYVKEVRIVLGPSAGKVEPLVDSMSLAGNAPSIADQSSNNPSTQNRKVPIEWGVDNSVTVATTTNPFVPGVTPIPDPVRSQYSSVIGSHTTGIVVGITSLKPLQQLSDGSYAEASIYDGVGNLVAKGIPVGSGKSLGVYGMHWDGRNRNGRIVGRGAYLISITYTDADGVVATKRVKAGVKR